MYPKADGHQNCGRPSRYDPERTVTFNDFLDVTLEMIAISLLRIWKSDRLQESGPESDFGSSTLISPE